MAWNKKFGELIGSGPWESIPTSFAKDEDSNLYTLFLAIMSAWDTEKSYQDIRDEERELINAVGKYLEYKAEYWGIIPFPAETTENLTIRADKYWTEFEGGGNEDSIKRALYYYIGEEAFGSVGWDITPHIIITDPREDSTAYYWNDADAKWGADGIRAEEDQYSFWSVETDTSGFGIIVELTSGAASGASYDITQYQYWNQDDKRVLLKEVVNLVKPLGIKYRLDVQVR
jgi:hypothetical protein